MRWNKSTRLGLYAALELARAGGRLVTAGEIARKFAASAHHLAKILQQLARAGIARSMQGVAGGYTLAKRAKDVTLLDVVAVFEGPAAHGGGARGGRGAAVAGTAGARLARVLDEIEQQAFFTLKSVRLSALVGD